ncbi:MAG: hypothetical protein A3J97_05010 [Spirochaetes bacterium RIFOXYC1_FULL_54_7]|nr:MAG: hypothetical protein A3J97_05010 [Spirochaetes bacterium RIFOXYC1_FULL_54_7]
MIRLKTIPLAVITAASILGGIMMAKAVGYYETTASKEPVKFKTGELAGLPNPADIRGSYTWQDLENAFGVPAVEAAAAFSAPDHALDPATRVSMLEEVYAGKVPEGLEIGTGAVRIFVSLYTSLPMEFEEGSVLPDAALALLASRPGADIVALAKLAIPGSSGVPMQAENAAAQAQHQSAATPAATPIPPAGTGSGTGSSDGSSTGTASTDRVIVGKTTFGDLYDWGLSEAQVASVLGYQPGPGTQTIRDSATANGQEFSEFRTKLRSLLDKTSP